MPSVQLEKGALVRMEKFDLAVVFRILFAAEGAFLIIYGFMTGANFLAIVNAFSSSRSPLSAKELYVILGLIRAMFAILGMKPSINRESMIVCGILLLSFSILGFVYCIITSSITASNVYGVVIEFIVMFILSLFYLIYAFKQVQS